MPRSAENSNWLHRLPQPGETCVFSHGYWDSYATDSERVAHWKRDALLFDRVYARCTDPSSPPDIPIELSFGLDSVEQSLRGFDASMGQMVAQAFAGLSADEVAAAMGPDPEGTLGYDRELAARYATAGIMGEWSYGSSGAYLRRFSEGEQRAYEGALSNIPLVLAESAPWDQILAFRADAEAVSKYRDLRLWLRSGLKAESVQHAADIIGQKVDDYRWAIKRHGLQTTLGAFKTIFDWKESKLSLAATGLAAATGGPMWAALAGGLSVAVQIGAWIAERRLDARDVSRGTNREVAILYDMQERFGRS
ncbi:MAG: hypothetical protein U0163_10365 [Gemmatimonadaceae bacterium]